jgi:hypothetical protein
MKRTAELLAELRTKRISFRYENGALRYSGPKGVINDEYRARLKECRDELIAIVIS